MFLCRGMMKPHNVLPPSTLQDSCCMFLVFQTELYPGRWDGSGENNPVHHAALRDLCYRYPRPLPHYCSPLHYHQLGEGVLHLDWYECHCLPWQLGQPTDDPAVRDVLQRWQGEHICYCLVVLLKVPRPPVPVSKFLCRTLDPMLSLNLNKLCLQGHLIPGAYKFDALITTFEMILSDCPELREISWRCVIIDEAHRLKNRNCKLLDSLKMLDLVRNCRWCAFCLLQPAFWPLFCGFL